MELGERDSTLKYLKLCENTAVKHGIHYFYLDVLWTMPTILMPKATTSRQADTVPVIRKTETRFTIYMISIESKRADAL